MPRSPTGPLTFLIPMVIRMPRTKSRVRVSPPSWRAETSRGRREDRARERFPRKLVFRALNPGPCEKNISLSSSGGEGWGEEALFVPMSFAFPASDLCRRSCFLKQASALTALGLALLLFPGCKPKEIAILLEPSQAMSSVLAEEAAVLAGAKKEVALITHDPSWGPPSSLEEGLKGALRKKGLNVVVAKSANLGNPMLSGTVGLKAADFLEALEKSARSGAIISLAGAPLLASAD